MEALEGGLLWGDAFQTMFLTLPAYCDNRLALDRPHSHGPGKIAKRLATLSRFLVTVTSRRRINKIGLIERGVPQKCVRGRASCNGSFRARAQRLSILDCRNKAF